MTISFDVGATAIACTKCKEVIELEPNIEELTEMHIDENALRLMDDCTTAINVVLFTLPPALALLVLRERTQAFAEALAVSPEKFAEFMAERGAPDGDYPAEDPAEAAAP
jgi:hypothetical protein